MRRFRIMGLCLVAAFAMSAIAVSSAVAAPEYYTNKNTCTGKFGTLWAGGTCPKTGKVLAATKVAYTNTGAGTSHLEGGLKIECSSDTGKGDLEGPKKTVKLKVTYKGCHESGNSTPCENKTTLLEQIITEPIKGELTEASKTEGGGLVVANRLEPEKTLFAKFVCGTTGHTINVEVKGKILAAVSPTFVKSEFTEAELISKLKTEGKSINAQKGVIAGCGGQDLLYENGVGPCIHLKVVENGTELEPSWNTAEDTVKYGTKLIGVYN
jgi:hypothetical protein